MIEEKALKAAEILKTHPDSKHKSGKDFVVTNKGAVEFWPIDRSPLAPVDETFLIISPYTEFAAAISIGNSRPVWLYDRIEDIQSMKLSKTSGADWVMLVCTREDFLKANILADQWTYGPHEVSVMMGQEKALIHDLVADYRPAQRG
jgi:hypothetical protein